MSTTRNWHHTRRRIIWGVHSRSFLPDYYDRKTRPSDNNRDIEKITQQNNPYAHNSDDDGASINNEITSLLSESTTSSKYSTKSWNMITTECQIAKINNIITYLTLSFPLNLPDDIDIVIFAPRWNIDFIFFEIGRAN